MSTDLDHFLTKVLPFAPGCPEPTAFEHLRTAAQDFCETTRLWRFEDSFELGDDPNLMCAPADSVIHEIERCDFNGRRLDPASLDWLDDRHPTWRSETHLWTGEPQWFTQTAPGTVTVAPLPTQGGRVKVWLRLKPSMDAETLPDFIAREYSTTIGWGALATILMLPRQTFSDPNMAVFFQGKFDQALGRKQKQGTAGQQRAPIRTKATFF